MQFPNSLAIATVSLGLHPSHTLPEKISAAASNGFSGIEIVYADLETYSDSQGVSMKAGAVSVKELCSTNNITILSLNPFKNFEGHSSPLETRLTTAREWIELARILGAKYLQVPSQFDTANSTGEEDVIVSELRALADAAQDQGIAIAYEAVSWGTHINKWQQSRDIVLKVNKANFGICLDAFHIISKIWGDNTSVTGKCVDGEDTLQASLDELVRELPLERLFYVQLSDGEFYNPPLNDGHRFWDASMDPRLIWSRNTRPFPLETELGAYFPIIRFAKACLMDLGWKGWVSMECFDWRMREKEVNPQIAAKRGIKSAEKILHQLTTTS